MSVADEIRRRLAVLDPTRFELIDDSALHAEFVAETARQLVFAQYGDETYSRGLNVYLTVSSADQMVAFVQEKRLTVQWILETHAHADHLTAATWLRDELAPGLRADDDERVRLLFGRDHQPGDGREEVRLDHPGVGARL